MNPNWLGVVCASLSVLAFPIVYRWGLKIPARARLWPTAAAFLPALPGASFAFYYTHLLPEPAWYFQFRSLPGTELLIIPIGLAGGLVATYFPRLTVMLPLLATVAFSVVPFMKPFVAPLPMSVLSDIWDGDVCKQSTPSTCGAASTATLLKNFGLPVTEAEVATAAHSYMGGTEAWYLARYIRARGLQARFHNGKGFEADIPLPALVGVRLGTVGHFIPMLVRSNGKFAIGDPLSGRELLTREELLERYQFTGFYMTVEKITSPGK
jgi:Peptidase C39 family